MLKWVCFSFYTLIFVGLYAQNEKEISAHYDKIAQAKDDTLKVKLLSTLSLYLRNDKRYEEQGVINKQITQLSQKLQFKSGIATGQLYEAERLANLEKNKESINEYLKCLPYIEKHKPAVGQTTNSKVGRLYYLIGDYPNALQFSLKALKTAELFNDEKSEGIYSGNIGNIYKQIKKPEKALEYYLKSLNISQKLDSKQSIAINQVQIGNLLQDNEEFEKAYAIFSEALVINESLNKPVYLGNNYLVLGQCARKLELLSDAHKYYNKAYETYSKINDSEGLTGVNIELAK